MKRYNGKSIFKGIAIGKIRILKKAVFNTDKREVSDTDAEEKRYSLARDTAIQELQSLFRKTREEIG